MPDIFDQVDGGGDIFDVVAEDAAPGAIGGAVGALRRGVMTAQQLVPGLLTGAPANQHRAGPSMFQGRTAFERAMEDPRYMEGLMGAGDDPAAIAKAESLFGPGRRSAAMQEAARAPVEALRGAVADIEADKQAVPKSPVQSALATARTPAEKWDVFARNPVQVVSGIVLESLPASIAGAAVGALGGPVGMAAGAGSASAATEFSQTLLGEAQKRGYDPADAAQLTAFLDGADYEDAFNKALLAGGIVGGADAATMGFAGTLVKPALKEGLKAVAKAGIKEVGVQAAGGSGGELAKQLATREPGEGLDVFDIAMEAVAEGLTGPVEAGAKVALDSDERAAARKLLADAVQRAPKQPEPAVKPVAAAKPTAPAPQAEPADLSPEALADLQAVMRGEKPESARLSNREKAMRGLPLTKEQAAEDKATREFLEKRDKNYAGMSALELELLEAMGDDGARSERKARAVRKWQAEEAAKASTPTTETDAPASPAPAPGAEPAPEPAPAPLQASLDPGRATVAVQGDALAEEMARAARPPRPLEAFGQGSGFTIADLVNESGGLTGPQLEEALAAMAEGRTPAQVVADWAGGSGRGGEYDALTPILEELREAAQKGRQFREFRDLAAAYRRAFSERPTAGRIDQTLQGIELSEAQGFTADGGRVRGPEDLIGRMWDHARGRTTVEPSDADRALHWHDVLSSNAGRTVTQNGGAGIPTRELQAGDAFSIRGTGFRVTGVDADGSVRLEETGDGRSSGAQFGRAARTINPEMAATIYPDRGSFVPVDKQTAPDAPSARELPRTGLERAVADLQRVVQRVAPGVRLRVVRRPGGVGQRSGPAEGAGNVGAPGAARGRERAWAVFERVFRRKIVVVEDAARPGEPLFFGGVVLRGHPGVLFLSENRSNGESVLGHEFAESLTIEDPALLERLRAELVPLMRDFPEYRRMLNALEEAHGQRLSDDATAQKELVADLVGDLLADPRFWDRLANRNPGLFRRVADAFMAWLQGVKERLRPYGAGQWFTDVQAAEDRVAAVLEEYASRAKPTGEGVRPATSEPLTAPGDAGDVGEAPDAPRFSLERPAPRADEETAVQAVAAQYGVEPAAFREFLADTTPYQPDLWDPRPARQLPEQAAPAVDRRAVRGVALTTLKAKDFAAEFAAGRRISAIDQSKTGPTIPTYNVNGTVINSPAEFARTMLALRSPNNESFKVAIVDDDNRVVHSEVMYAGTLDTVLFDSRDFARLAQKHKGRNILMAHNHPSGEVSPSEADVRLTERAKKFAKAAGFTVVDHVITNGDKYYSFREGERDLALADQIPAPWEVTRRGSLRRVDTGVLWMNLVAELRTAATREQMHLVYLDTRMRVNAIERIPAKAVYGAKNERILARLVLRGVGREAANAVMVDFGPSVPRDTAVRLARGLKRAMEGSGTTSQLREFSAFELPSAAAEGLLYDRAPDAGALREDGEFQFDAPESVDQQRARLDQERQARDAREREEAAREELARRRDRRLVGDLGDAGQGSLFADPGQQELFRPGPEPEALFSLEPDERNQRMGELAAEMRRLREAIRSAPPEERRDLQDELASVTEDFDELARTAPRPRGGIPIGLSRVDQDLAPGEPEAPAPGRMEIPRFQGPEKLEGGRLRDLLKGLVNWRRKTGNWLARSGARTDITVGRDAGDNRAAQAANEATSAVRLRLNRAFGATGKRVMRKEPLREAALTFVIEADGDRGKLQEFYNAIHASEHADTKAGRQALQALRFADEHWDRFTEAAELFKRITTAEREIELNEGVNSREWQGGYVPHVWLRDEGGGGGADPTQPRPAGTPFRRRRTVATYADGIADGREPKTLNALELLAGRVDGGQKRVNELRWLYGLRHLADPVTTEPVVTDVIRRPARPHDVPSGPQGRAGRQAETVPDEEFAEMRKAKWETIAPEGYVVWKLGDAEVAVHRNFAGLLTKLTAPSFFKSAPAKKVFGFMKSALLMFDTFHLGRMVAWRNMFGGHLSGFHGYKRGLNLLDFTESDIREMAQRGEIPASWEDGLVENKRRLDLAVQTGFNIGNVLDNAWGDVMHNLPLVGTFNHWLFGKYQRGAMAEAWLIEFERQRRGARPDESEETTARRVSRDLNARFGNLNRQGLFKSRTAQDIARFVFLAPQWNESLIRAELGAIGQAGRVALNAATGRKLVVGSLLRATGTMLIGTFLANQILNWAFRGKPTWENEEEGWDKKLSAWIPDAIGGGPGFFLNPLALPMEYTHLFDTQLHKSRDTADALWRIGNSRLHSPTRAGLMLATRKDPLGRSIKPGEVTAEIAKSLVPLPIPTGTLVGAGEQLLTGQGGESYPGQFQKQAMASFGIKTDQAPSAEQRIRNVARSFNESKGIVPHAEFFAGDFDELTRALRLGNREDAREYLQDVLAKKTRTQVAEHYKRWAAAPFTGQRAREKEFWRSLTEEQRERYMEARRARQEVMREAMALLRQARPAPAGR